MEEGISKEYRCFNLQASCLLLRPSLSVSEVCREFKETSYSK
jgi:hypothetical protein